MNKFSYQQKTKRVMAFAMMLVVIFALGVPASAARGKRLMSKSSYKSIGRLQAGLKSVLHAKKLALKKLEDDSASTEEEAALREKIAKCKLDEKHIRAEIGVVRSLRSFHKPVPGRITSGFGHRFHPILKVHRDHNGIDLAGAMGDSVSAAWSGQVIVAGYQKGYGNAVIIEHPGGRTSVYGHLSGISVEVGQTVHAGEKVGEIGTSGLSTGPHLHFEIRLEGRAIDPRRYW
jgi:murein DD-endopeptidase MepM/ murein hydrolase activator NlpD